MRVPSELVDSAVTAGFSAGDSVVMDGRASGPASSASCRSRRGPSQLCYALADGVAADDIILDISAVSGFAMDVRTAGGSAAGGSAGNSGAARQPGGWQRGGWQRCSSFNLEQQLLGLKLIITIILSVCDIDDIHR